LSKGGEYLIQPIKVRNFYTLYVKHAIDWLVALIAAIILTPLFVIIALLIKIDSTGPVFFRQERLGQGGRIFIIYKFRSMVIHQVKNNDYKLYENDPRITFIGKFIRRTSIDELPQVINILKREMSFIGPRPPLPYFPKHFKEYTDFEKQRFRVKPGISGLAQIRCREIHDWDINIPIDVEYVNNCSFIYDLKLFLKSFIVFFKTDNIYRKD